MGLAAIYARVSSTRQKEEQTIASQTQALREHAAASGLEVPPGWIFEDEGYSGATLIRPALERLRDLAAEVDVPVVLCYAPDRLARRYAYQALLVDEFARVGTEVRFLKGPKASTPACPMRMGWRSTGRLCQHNFRRTRWRAVLVFADVGRG